MRANVLVLKEEIRKTPGLQTDLAKLCKEVKENDADYVFVPSPGLLLKFISLLKERNVDYTASFNRIEDPEDELFT